jgi:hypothetical protein
MTRKNTSGSPTKSHKTPSKQTIKVPGHWVYPLGFRKDGAPKKGYYVRPYKYERKSTKGKKRAQKPQPKLLERVKVIGGVRYVLDEHFEFSEPEERVVYTYKIEALVEYSGRYTMAFSLDKDLAGQKAIEFYHTKFEATPDAAKEDLREQIALLKAYGHVIDFMSVDLYRVSGEGPLRVKHWKLLKSYDSPEKVK